MMDSKPMTISMITRNGMVEGKMSMVKDWLSRLAGKTGLVEVKDGRMDTFKDNKLIGRWTNRTVEILPAKERKFRGIRTLTETHAP